jgi:hypothetical protein
MKGAYALVLEPDMDGVEFLVILQRGTKRRPSDVIGELAMTLPA